MSDLVTPYAAEILGHFAPELSRPQFERACADFLEAEGKLSQDKATTTARAIVAEYLADEGVAYGVPHLKWDTKQAQVLAFLYIRGGSQ